MESTRPNDLVSLLRGRTLRNRVGLWLMPVSFVGHEPNEAARLGIDAVDIRQPLLAGLPEGTRFLGLSAGRVMELLDEICRQPERGDCLLVCNMDLLLARLERHNRLWVWSQLFNGFPYRPRALLIVVPQTAIQLLPMDNELMGWRRERRLAEGIH